ncbi:MAG: hypothetical protein IPM35_08900 [Myxococcales bacterium]|nr:hypothetical protein [Myxococcales bacterium]
MWSWGVIHHSSRTGRIVREIARLLRPEGETRVMVYNRHAASVMLSVLRDQLVHGGFRRRTLEESYYAASDGYSARFYTQDQFEDLFRAFFSNVTSSLCGQEVDAVPLPAGLRRWVTRLLPDAYLRRAQERRGAFILLGPTTRSENRLAEASSLGHIWGSRGRPDENSECGGRVGARMVNSVSRSAR